MHRRFRKRVTPASMAGITLIELMIVVVIVAILAGIAIPNYRQYVLRSNRTDATAALMRVAAAQEKFYLQNNRYSDNATALIGRGTSERGWYQINVAAGDTGSLLTSFTATATPVAGQVQASDTRCTSFTLKETGARGASDLTECWR